MASSNLELSRVGGRYNHDVGELILAADLNKIGDIGLRTLCQTLAVLFWDPANDVPQSGFPRDISDDDHVKVTATGDLTFSVASGWGMVFDSADVGTQEFAPSSYLPVVLEAAFTGTLAAHDATNPRIDLVCIAPAYALDQSATRNVKNPTTGAISSSSIAARKRFSSAITIVTGTPASSPAAPAVPAGAIEIARARVPAASGAATWRDHRPPLQVSPAISRPDGGDYVLASSELQVLQNTGMTVGVVEGRARIGGLARLYKRGTVTITASDPANPRIDLVVADEDGTLSAVAGTAAATPVAPSAGAGQLALATVAVGAAATSIVTANITDRRVFRSTDEVFVSLGTPVLDGGGDFYSVPISLKYPDGSAYLGPFGEQDTKFIGELWRQDVDSVGGTHAKTAADFAVEAGGGTLIGPTLTDETFFYFKPASGDADDYNRGGAPAAEGPLIFWMPTASGTIIVERENAGAITGTFHLTIRPINRPGGCTASVEMTF